VVMDYDPWVIKIRCYIGNVSLGVVGIGLPLYRG
jgi:hypothetical protein